MLTRHAFLTSIVLLEIIFLGQAALAQIGFSGSSSSFGAGELLGAVMLVAFTGLMLWGWHGIALLAPPSLPPQRRVALRWIGVNRLEPSVTTLLSIIVFVVWTRSETFDSPFSSLWFALPAMSFFSALLPPIWFRSTLDAVVQDTWQGLRLVAVARVAPCLLLALSLPLAQAAGAAIAGLLIGLGSLFWSLRETQRLAAQLYTFAPPSQPITTSERMDADAYAE